MLKVPEQFRITGPLADRMKAVFRVNDKVIDGWIFLNTQVGDEETGMFILPNPKTGKGMMLLCKSSGGEGWEHVSISVPSESRCPTWEEMCFVKAQFWNDPEDVVIQYHPAKKDYISMHNYCLHLWRKKGINFETPPSELVGINVKK